MKICDTYEALLDLYLDAELSPDEMVRVQAHLNECPACRSYVDDMLTIRAALPSVEETVVPEHFLETVMAAVSAQAAPRRARHAPWSKILLPLAACCAIVILLQNGSGFGFGSSKQESPAAYTEAARVRTTADEAAPAEAVTEEGAPEETLLLEDSAVGEPAAAALPETETAPAAEPAYEYTVDSSQTEEAKTVEFSPYRLRICVDAAYIGDLLNAYTPLPAQENISMQEVWYELTFSQYQMLLESLSDRSELPAEELLNTSSDTVLIIVRHR